MGNQVAKGRDNDELIKNLKESGHITSKKFERLFKAVDRGNYFLEEEIENAYNDSAWKHGNFHVSAPCIYANAIVALDIKPGNSFLNIGSGTGYFSTLVGLLLGVNGINHGIELHTDVVEFAEKQVKQFIQHGKFFDWYDFCPPQFVVGNCLDIERGNNLYDRVYCGAEVADHSIDFLKRFLRIGGILVLPHNDVLKKITRQSENHWVERRLLTVTFASLILNKPDQNTRPVLPQMTASSLNNICRSVIRRHLRNHLIPFTPGPTDDEENIEHVFELDDENPQNNHFHRLLEQLPDDEEVAMEYYFDDSTNSESSDTDSESLYSGESNELFQFNRDFDSISVSSSSSLIDEDDPSEDHFRARVRQSQDNFYNSFFKLNVPLLIQKFLTYNRPHSI